MRFRPLIVAVVALLMFSEGAFAATSKKSATPLVAPVTIPRIACPQSTPDDGIIAAANPGTEQTMLDKRIADRVADYGGVLAPRGWHCLVAVASSGQILFIGPDPLTDVSVSFKGPAIQVSNADGSTGGMYEVARYINRVFPRHKDEAEKAIEQNEWPAGNFPAGVFAADRITYKRPDLLEFRTPANTEGLGTMSRLYRSDAPIDGVALLFPKNGADAMHLKSLSVRLPADMKDLAPVIIQHYEAEAVKDRATLP